MRFKVFIVVTVALFAATPLARSAAHSNPTAGNAAARLHVLDGFDWH